MLNSLLQTFAVCQVFYHNSQKVDLDISFLKYEEIVGNFLEEDAK